MSKFNITGTRAPAGQGPIQVDADEPVTNHEGGRGFTRDNKSDLLLLATTTIDLTADAFYEGGDARVKRYVALIREMAVTDPGWTYQFLVWLRSKGNIRTAATVGAVEAARAMVAAGVPGGRQIVADTCLRADEPGEGIAYHLSRYGRAIPKALKRGWADAAARLYTERTLLKYDTAAHAVRFGDVLDLTHPTPRPAPEVSVADVARVHDVDPDAVEARLRQVAATIRRENPDGSPVALGTAEFLGYTGGQVSGWRAAAAAAAIGIPEQQLVEETAARQLTWQADLFTYALNRRHGRDDMVPASLNMVIANRELRDHWVGADGLAGPGRDFPAQIQRAGMTWEDVLSALGSKVDKKILWEALIPTMGYMALLRNLRNFDQAGVSDAVAQAVINRLMDPAEVARSRQLPLRFLSAYRAAPSLRWAWPLEQALDLSVNNIPALPGRTLILIDTSGSMNDTLSDRSDLRRWDAAVSFGLALARRCAHADVYAYSTRMRRFPAVAGESLLKSIERWQKGGFFFGDGTNTPGALAAAYSNHDRALILTDEQDGQGWHQHTGGALVTDQMPPTRPLYTWNLAGYVSSHSATDPNRITLGGLTDHMFAVIPTVEARRPGLWPWTGDPDIGTLRANSPGTVSARTTASAATDTNR